MISIINVFHRQILQDNVEKAWAHGTWFRGLKLFNFFQPHFKMGLSQQQQKVIGKTY